MEPVRIVEPGLWSLDCGACCGAWDVEPSVEPEMWILLWSLGYGACCGLWDVEPGMWSLVCRAWIVDPGLWGLGCGSWFVEPGLWILVCGDCGAYRYLFKMLNI